MAEGKEKKTISSGLRGEVRPMIQTARFVRLCAGALVLLLVPVWIQAAPAERRGGEVTAVYRAGNIESLDPPSASAGTDWRMVGLLLYNTLYG